LTLPTTGIQAMTFRGNSRDVCNREANNNMKEEIHHFNYIRVSHGLHQNKDIISNKNKYQRMCGTTRIPKKKILNTSNMS